MREGAVIAAAGFQRIGEASLDERKRISLARCVEQLKKLVSGSKGLDQVRFGIYVNEVGQFLLSPEVSVPIYETWLLRNPEALAKVKEGLQQAAEGQLESIGSFAKYADDEID